MDHRKNRNEMSKPAYLSAVNIKCMADGCQQIVKSNGISVVGHLVLRHKFSPGETGLLCRRHAVLAGNFTGDSGNWEVAKFETIEQNI